MAGDTARSQRDALVADSRRAMLRGLVYIGLLSAVLNLLQLCVPLYMMQVHDRVLSSRSMDTLTLLTLITVAGLLLLGILEFLRGAALLTLGAQFLRRLNLPLVEAALHASLRDGSAKASQALRDLTEIRGFFANGAAGAPLEAAWSPIFMLALASFHPLYGLIALLSSLLILAFSLLGDLVSKSFIKESNAAQVEVYASVGGSLRHAEAIDSMGMIGPLGRRWQAMQVRADGFFAVGMRRNKMISAASKTVRYGMQIAALALGAILVIGGNVSPGTMMAASILMARTLQPFDSMVENWRQWRGARAAWSRVQEALATEGAERDTTPLPRPEGGLVVEKLVYAAPGSTNAILKSLDFAVLPGEVLGVVGPSAAGKSTLARLLAGVAKPNSGGAYLGGHNVYTAERQSFGRWIGYLPQSVGLLDGTIRDNIARLRTDEDDPAETVRAARLAGVHDMIGRMPLGYDTRIGDARLNLSGGQMQRIGIARAVYGEPALVVLDEPNAHLDVEGEQAVVRAIARLKAAGAVVVVIAHRAAVLQAADKLLMLGRDGAWQFGPAEAVAAAVGGPAERVALNSAGDAA